MSTATWKILQGHSLEVLRRLESESVQTCITSPPYFGLRDYGLEPRAWDETTECEHEWNHYEAVRQSGGHTKKQLSNKGANDDIVRADSCACGAWQGQLGLEPTPELFVSHLVQIFREVRRVLRNDGTLWLNIGDSYNTKPASNGVSFRRDRASVIPSKSKRIERGSGRWGGGKNSVAGLKNKDLIGIPWLLAFALRTDGWYLRSEIIWHKPNPMPESVTDRPTKSHEQIFLLSKSATYFYDANAIKEPSKEESGWAKQRAQGVNTWDYGRNGYNESRIGGMSGKETFENNGSRNKRSVWTTNTQPFPDAHFAVFPEDLITPCVLAGSKEGDTVLDPFSGSGTTGLVSVKYGRNYVGIELNPSYVKMSEDRIRRCAPSLFSEQIA